MVILFFKKFFEIFLTKQLSLISKNMRNLIVKSLPSLVKE
jgi:hypothetical protein